MLKSRTTFELHEMEMEPIEAFPFSPPLTIQSSIMFMRKIWKFTRNHVLCCFRFTWKVSSCFLFGKSKIIKCLSTQIAPILPWFILMWYKIVLYGLDLLDWSNHKWLHWQLCRYINLAQYLWKFYEDIFLLFASTTK